MDRDTEADRTTVAQAAGLSEMHGGAASTHLHYQVECPKEPGLVLAIERVWDAQRGNPESHIPMECPICGDEHLLSRRS